MHMYGRFYFMSKIRLELFRASRIACIFTFTANISDMNHFAKDCRRLVELLPAWFGLFLKRNSHGL